MDEKQQAEWQQRLNRMREQSPLKGTEKDVQNVVSGNIGAEALMTLIAIMKDDSDPKLQMAAAKVLLDKGGMPAQISQRETPETMPADKDDVDAAIALAKAVLDELARSKTQKLDGKGTVVIDSAAGADNPAG